MLQPKHAPASPGGSMTSAMRAVPRPAGPRVLRICLVQRGRIVDERVIAGRGELTVGTTEECQFVVAGADVPPAFRLFERRGDEVLLHLLDGMRGRVAGASGVSDVAELARTGERVRVGGAEATTTRLAGDARGKLVLGDSTFLFQLVPAPPAAARPALPSSLASGLGADIDWTTTIVAAFSFLVHFGSAGTVFTDWMDPVVDEAVDVAGLLHAIEGLPAPPVVETPSDAPDGAPATARTSAPTDAPRAPRTPEGHAGPARGDPGGAPRVGDRKAAEIAGQLAELDVQMVGTLSARGRATDVVLQGGNDVVLGRLDEAAASAAGARAHGIGELRSASSARPWAASARRTGASRASSRRASRRPRARARAAP
jgi:hypothetical protein